MNDVDIINIAVIFALKQEARYFKPPADVRVFICGMGNKNAEKFIAQFLSTHSPKMVFTCGLAGALNPGLKLNSIVFESSEENIVSKMLKSFGAIEGRFLCSPKIICSSQEKLTLYKTTNADAVEMESGIIQRICSQRKIPCVTLRVISDTAGEDLPLNFNEFIDSNGEIRLKKLFSILAKNPRLIARLINFQKQTNTSARVLGEFLTGFFYNFCSMREITKGAQ